MVAKDVYSYHCCPASGVIYRFQPKPIAPRASLHSDEAIRVVVTVETSDLSHSPVPGGQVWLSLLQAPGGGSASVGDTDLAGVPVEFLANENGQLVITYVTPSTLPASGNIDGIRAEFRTWGGPTVNNSDTYTF